jgi:preprotein translocase subunit SecY
VAKGNVNPAAGLGQAAKFTEVRQRLLFLIGALIVYRIGTFVPVPGIDPEALAQLFEQQSGTILSMFNMFSGGALERLSIFALGVMPYISASIIIQMATVVLPSLSALKKEGESGRRKIMQYTRYFTVALASFQSVGASVALQNQGVVISPGPHFIFTAAVTLVTGTMFLMWLGEQITARGIGNGISLIIFAGIIAGLPSAIAAVLELGRTGQMSTFLIIGIIVLALVTIAVIVFMERAQRRLLVKYPKRQVGNQVQSVDPSHLPLKLNTAGVIPPIFASSLLLLPITVSNFSQGSGPDWLNTVNALLGRGQPLFLAIYIALIIFFAFFYTAIMFNPKETADNLKKYGGFIPGIRPGERTAEYIDYVLTRITVVGALYLAAICLLPEILTSYAHIPFYFGGTSLLIIVSVTMDTVTQVQSHLLAQQYEGLMKKTKLRGSRR